MSEVKADVERPGRPAVGVVVINWNGASDTIACLESLAGLRYPGLRVYVVDNGSSDESRIVLAELGRELPWLVAHHGPVNLQHGPALDRLLRDHCRADWVLVLDSDTRVRHDFRAALPSLAGEAPAFIGQVHPEASQLYAYMCHLLVNRSWYAQLPPFDAEGAPGRAFFAAVAARGVHWRRFRWTDHVEHYGQGTLRRLVERRETAHPLYRFAAEQSRHDGHRVDAADRERVLLFSDAYLENRLILVGRKGTDVAARTLAMLEGKRVAIVGGYSYGDIDKAGPVFVRTQSEEDSLRQLLQGKADYVLMDELVVRYIVSQHPAEAQASADVVAPMLHSLRVRVRV